MSVIQSSRVQQSICTDCNDADNDVDEFWRWVVRAWFKSEEWLAELRKRARTLEHDIDKKLVSLNRLQKSINQVSDSFQCILLLFVAGIACCWSTAVDWQWCGVRISWRFVAQWTATVKWAQRAGIVPIRLAKHSFASISDACGLFKQWQFCCRCAYTPSSRRHTSRLHTRVRSHTTECTPSARQTAIVRQWRWVQFH